LTRRGVRPPIQALFFDVDGVLTDGRIYLADDGNDFKVFDTRDGHGIKMAVLAGLKVAWISGRTSRATARRAKELGVHACVQGVAHDGKLARYADLCRRWRIAPAATAAMGDDEPDAPLLEAAGFSACPADAVPAIRKIADVVLENRGGRGAVREFIELVLEKNAKKSGVRGRGSGVVSSRGRAEH
jgi:3-deoxy-D-manno-octulosonate 8-phosphate phosphatase (KDO 8-P phosphatase)